MMLAPFGCYLCSGADNIQTMRFQFGCESRMGLIVLPCGRKQDWDRSAPSQTTAESLSWKSNIIGGQAFLDLDCFFS